MASQRRSRVRWSTVGPVCARASRSAGSNASSVSTRMPRAPNASAIDGEVDRSEVGPDRAPPASLLVGADRSVALVVEHDRDDPRALADRGLQLRHGHRKTAVTDKRNGWAVRSGQRGGDGRREAVAHRPGRRADERCRPTEPVAARGPRGEIAGVGRQDGVGRENAGQGRDDSAGVHAGARPVVGVDDARRLEGIAVRAIRRRPRVDELCLQGAALEPLDRGAQEAAHVGREGERRRTETVGAGARLEIDVRPRLAAHRDGVVERGNLVQPRAKDQERVGLADSRMNR